MSMQSASPVGLLPCDVCGHQVADNAVSCPGCGCVFDTGPKEVQRVVAIIADMPFPYVFRLVMKVVFALIMLYITLAVPIYILIAIFINFIVRGR